MKLNIPLFFFNLSLSPSSPTHTQIQASQRQYQTRVAVAYWDLSAASEGIFPLVLWRHSLLLQIETGQDKTSRVRGDSHARFCGRHGVKVPVPPRPIISNTLKI